MKIIPCEKNAELRATINEYAEALKIEAHKLGKHGLGEREFYDTGIFRGAIERIRGQISAEMKGKRAFVKEILNYMEDRGFIQGWESTGGSNRHDYSVTVSSNCVAVIELKGCLDGNNTTIFERPKHANEFVIWSLCTNAAADPNHNAWSGIHTRLSAEIISREQQVDGLVIWDMACGTIGRPCPKIIADPSRVTEVGPYKLTPPCIYLFPATLPSPRNNPHPIGQPVGNVQLLNAFHKCFGGKDDELNYVDFEVRHEEADTVRITRVRRGAEILRESKATAIRRS